MAASSSRATPPKRSTAAPNKRALTIAAAVGVVVVLLVCWIVFRSRSSPETTPEGTAGAAVSTQRQRGAPSPPARKPGSKGPLMGY
jgi:hypothetical protein